MPDLLRSRAQSATPAVETSVILLWLQGGPSHLETWDMKPDAPAEFRGEFNPIQTAVPGLNICEHMPQQAKIASKFNIVRSLTHDVIDHPGAAWRFLTGRRPINISALDAKFPSIECVVAKSREHLHTDLPAYVSNDRHQSKKGAAYLGPTYDPFLVMADPSKPDFKVDNLSLNPSFSENIDDRMTLLKSFDAFRRKADDAVVTDRFNQMALQMITSDRARCAFDIQQESTALRDRYGRTEVGQRLLLARRLIEAGISFVTVEMHGWDDHGDSGMIFDNLRKRLPVLDQALSALIEDVHARGLDRRVMVIACGEFGREPRLSKRPAAGAKIGRDHWPSAMSLLVSGGGMQTGQVIGETTSKGETPKQRRLDPNDFLATVYRFLGIDPEHSFLDFTGRPMPILPYGNPIRELM